MLLEQQIESGGQINEQDKSPARTKAEKEKARQEIIRDLADLRKSFNPYVPINRVRPGDPPSQAAITFLYGVQSVLLRLLESKLLKPKQAQQLLGSWNRLGEMIKERDRISYEKKEYRGISDPSKYFREAFERAYSKVAALNPKDKFVPDDGTPGSDFDKAYQETMMRKALGEMDPEVREKFLENMAGVSRPESRVPLEGPVPEDIRNLVKIQVQEINGIINMAFNHLGAMEYVERFIPQKD